MTRRPPTTRVAEYPDNWYFGPQARRLLEGSFPAPRQAAGETLVDYLERRYRALMRTGMSKESVAIALRVEGRKAGDERMAEVIIAWHDRPNEREGNNDY